MNGARHPDHPDDDLLADLAADVLPTDQARVVEAHVMACGRCAQLLTDAERVRALLLSSPAGPMPDDVLSRIEAALGVEYAAREGRVDGTLPTAPQRVRVITPWEDTQTIEAYQAAQRRTAGRRPGPETAADERAPEALPLPPPPGRSPRLARPSRGPSASRRDLRQEVRDLRAGRRGTLLAAAAGIVVVVGLGGYAGYGFLNSTRSQTQVDSAAGEAASVKGGTASRVLATGTDYTKATLTRQGKELLALADRPATMSRQAAPAVSGETAPTATVASGVPAPTAAGGGASGPVTGDQSLRDPAKLQGCLAALNATSQRVMAVDLSRYQGQDAAIIVLARSDGGYEVWVVGRGCGPDNDGTLDYQQLPG